MTPPPLFSSISPPQSVGGSAKEVMEEKHGKFAKRINSAEIPNYDKPMAVPYHRGYAYQTAKRGGGVTQLFSLVSHTKQIISAMPKYDKPMTVSYPATTARRAGNAYHGRTKEVVR